MNLVLGSTAKRNLALGLAMSLLITLGAIPAANGVELAETRDSYIVTLKDGASVSEEVSNFRKRKGVVKKYFTAAMKGMVVEANHVEISSLLADPDVLSVEPDLHIDVAETQNAPTWGLDRIDQSSLPLNSKFNYTSTGQGVDVYVVDTGVLATHREFTGRVGQGFSVISDGYGTRDRNGHGTHVAGTIAGSTYGVAKSATIVPVRVLDSRGSGTTSGVIAGLNWIAAQVSAGSKAVVSMSLGGGYSQALNNAVESLVDEGVSVVVAAGNDYQDACGSSPSSALNAITVGATDISDGFAWFSNWGNCVDILAPGVNITSAWIGSNTRISTISGTSMATPHVSGVIAQILEQGYRAPSEVNTILAGNAVSGTISLVPGGTPNRLLHYRGSFVPVPELSPVEHSTTASVGDYISTPVFTASNFEGSLTYTLVSGTLPTGLTFDAATGVIAGTASSAQASVTYSIQAFGSIAGIASATRSIVINPLLGVPAAPVLLTAESASGRRANISWGTGFDGGSAITKYVLRTYSANGTLVKSTNLSRRATSARVTGLVVGSSYYFTLSASNRFGDSQVAVSNSVTATR